AARIPGAPGAPLAHLERAEPTDLEMLALGQRAAERIQQLIHDQSRVVLRHSRLRRDLLDQIRFRHRDPPRLRSQDFAASRHAQPAAPQGPGTRTACEAGTATTDGCRSRSSPPQRGHRDGWSPARVASHSNGSPQPRQAYSYTGIRSLLKTPAAL